MAAAAVPQVDPGLLFENDVVGTSNAVERAMIHAVVARKVSSGHRFCSGAKAWVVLAGVCRTAGKQGRNVLETVKRLLMNAWAEAGDEIGARSE